MIFETERLLVRHYTMDDAEDFYLLNSDPEVMKYIRAPKTRQQALQFLRENIDYYLEFPLYGRWALIEKKDNHFAGSFMLRPSVAVKGKIELGYALFKNYWGKGFATEATKGGIDYAFAKLKLHDLIAITQTENISSKQVLVKCGFRQLDDLQETDRIVNLFAIESPRHD